MLSSIRVPHAPERIKCGHGFVDETKVNWSDVKHRGVGWRRELCPFVASHTNTPAADWVILPPLTPNDLTLGAWKTLG